MVTLSKVLEILQNGEIFSVQLLAQKLDDTPESVRSALELLEKMGRVRKVNMGMHCGHSCKGCASPCQGKGTEAVRWEWIRDF